MSDMKPLEVRTVRRPLDARLTALHERFRISLFERC